MRAAESIKTYQEIPPFRPLPLGSQPLTKQPAVMNVTIYKIPFIHQEVAEPSPQQQQRLHQETNLKQSMQQDTLALQMLKQQRLQQQQQVIATQSTKNQMNPVIFYLV